MSWKSLCVRAAMVGIGLMAMVSAASAQTRVKVTSDQTSIWSPSMLTIAAIVSLGTELEVVSQRGNWYEVILPPMPFLPSRIRAERRTGFVAMTRVVVIESAPLEPADASSSAAAETRGGFRAFRHVGYGRFRATDAFSAFLGQSSGVWWGGGGAYTFASGAFIEASVDRFRETGVRPDAGLPETVTATPMTATLGYRLGRRALTPYAGGGIGRYFFTEESRLPGAPESLSRSFTSYHALGGLDWHVSGLFGTGVEIQYAHVPNALEDGFAAAFDERHLGGVNVRVKFFVGR
jgi:hypothetical protein